MQPILNEIYVQTFPPVEQAGALFVPDSAKRRSNKALVLKTGSGTKLCPMPVQEGDTVFIIQGAGVPFVNEQGDTFWLVASTDCLAYTPKATAPFVAAPLRVFEADLDSAEGLRRVAAGEAHPYLPIKNIKQTN